MRKVDRNARPGPASLLTPGRAGANELERAIAHYARPDAGKFNFRAYKEDDVRHCLEALFFGKCAYCESRYDVSGPVDIEHFRPKGGIEDVDGHPGYWWLAAEWTNLLPSCLDCNRRRYQPTPREFASLTAALQSDRDRFAPIKTGKETCFPISEAGQRMQTRPNADMAETALTAEQALLLDPCRDNPVDHLRFYIDRESPLGIIYPVRNDGLLLPELPDASEKIKHVENAARKAGISVRGAVSIQVYGLNRLALLQERTRLLRRLEFLGSVVLDLSRVADNLEGLKIAKSHAADRAHAVKRLRATVSRTLSEIRGLGKPDAPFSAMVRTWIDVFKADMANPASLPAPEQDGGKSPRNGPLRLGSQKMGARDPGLDPSAPI